jgi:Pentapeptide repeats (8 copies)
MHPTAKGAPHPSAAYGSYISWSQSSGCRSPRRCTSRCISPLRTTSRCDAYLCANARGKTLGRAASGFIAICCPTARRLIGKRTLQCASLENAQLQGASLDHAELQGAVLRGARLQDSSIVGAFVWRANFSSTQHIGTLVVNPIAEQVHASGPRPCSLERPCPFRSEDYEALVQTIKLIPNNVEPILRLKRLDPAEPLADEQANGDILAQLTQESPALEDYQKHLANRLKEVGCDPNIAPFMFNCYQTTDSRQQGKRVLPC